MTRTLAGIFTCLVCLIFCANSYAQSYDPGTNSERNAAVPQPKSDSPHALPAGAGNGGRAIQDWSTLMMLISQTVDPDEWRDFGGTGESTMIPYPNGVWIDAHGHLERMQRRDILPKVQDPAAHQKWMRASGLRCVSLKKLDAQIEQQRKLGLTPSHELQNLAGLSHVEYVLLDREAHDVVLAGPVSGQMSVLDLEDVCLLLNVMNDHTRPLGCSLDPSDQGLKAAVQFLNQPNAMKRLARSPGLVTEQLKKQVGPHDVHVFGIEPRCSTALALVNADELMKRYGLGLEKSPVGIKTYFDHLAREKSVKPQSLIRWWFAYNDQPVIVNSDNRVYQLPKQAINVLSQQQWIALSGQRAPTGDVDPAADAFAKEFSDKFLAIAGQEPAFARIEGIFELGLAFQLAIDGSQQPSLVEWFPNLVQTAQSICLNERAPTNVDGVTAHQRLGNGTVVAIISGGVTLDPTFALSAASSPTAKSEQMHQTIQLKPKSVDRWWWD